MTRGNPTKPAGCFLQIAGGGLLIVGIARAASGGGIIVAVVMIIIGLALLVLGGQAVR